jgi:hypothetical protein
MHVIGIVMKLPAGIIRGTEMRSGSKIVWKVGIK